MSQLGMWMPTQKEGLNWQVIFTCIENGEEYTTTKKYRVRQNAQDGISRIRQIEQTHEGVERGFKVKSSKLTKIQQ